MSKWSVSPSKVYVNEGRYDLGTCQVSDLRTLKVEKKTWSTTTRAEEMCEVYASSSICSYVGSSLSPARECRQSALFEPYRSRTNCVLAYHLELGEKSKGFVCFKFDRRQGTVLTNVFTIQSALLGSPGWVHRDRGIPLDRTRRRGGAVVLMPALRGETALLRTDIAACRFEQSSFSHGDYNTGRRREPNFASILRTRG